MGADWKCEAVPKAAALELSGYSIFIVVTLKMCRPRYRIISCLRGNFFMGWKKVILLYMYTYRQ